MTNGQELQRTSDVMLAQLSELEDLEQQKRSLPDGSEAQLRLSRQVETLARKVLRVAGEQTEIVETIGEINDVTTGSQPPAPRESHLILSDWRAAERSLDEHSPGTPKWEAARADVERLRAEYRRAFRIKGDQPGD